jgi:glycosyltransferase involved in cell wall biosynthesis
MPAYNYGRYVGRAIESVLEQEYPPERLRLIVVDDGSTDDTGEVAARLAEAHPERVLLIRQPNAGPSAAINRALGEATAELIAVLDADDIWLPAKTRRQAQRLADDPLLGLVFCDMRVVDADERLVRPSQVGAIGAFPRRALATLLFQNVITQSSLMIRRELARQLPAEIPYSDWWFGLCAAQSHELEYLPEPLALYREHGANLTSGVSGASGVREHRKEIAFQTWALRHLELGMLSAEEIKVVWAGVERHAGQALGSAGTHFVELLEVTAEDREQARRFAAEAEAAQAAGDRHGACALSLRAVGWDPYDPKLLVGLRDALEREQLGAP